MLRDFPPALDLIRLVVAVTIENNIDLHQFDVEQELVQSKLDTNI